MHSTIRTISQISDVLRGKLLPLVNGYPFTRMAEWSNLHMWRRQRPKSWVWTQPNPLSLLRNMREKHLLCHGKAKKPWTKKFWWSWWENGPDHTSLTVQVSVPESVKRHTPPAGKWLSFYQNGWVVYLHTETLPFSSRSLLATSNFEVTLCYIIIVKYFL